MTPHIAVLGSLNIDLVARCHTLPEPGETIGGAVFSRVPGGKGANQAVAAARLGARVTFGGRVGADRFALDALAREGVDVSRVAEDDGESGVALILVDDEGENVIVVAPGANGRLGAGDVQLPAADAVLCQLEVPVEAVVAAAEGAQFFCLNAAPAVKVPSALLERAGLVVVNRFELDALDSTPPLTALTLGAEGAVLLENGVEVARATPPRVDAVDGTAAGDAFCAALLVYLLRGHDREHALRLACVAGALAASRFGAQPSLPTAAEVEQLAR
ncbi:MAG: ribokinase [Gaiellaceae bacterium]|nr:ribokinase [Gaiellaceae bacterium]